MDKKELRKRLMAQRKALTVEEVQHSSELVCKHILESEAYKRAQYILGYLAFGKELSVDRVLEEALRDGKRVFVPHIISGTEFEAAELSKLQNFVLDRFGIRSVAEPIKVLEPAKLDLVLVPAVAFARDGHRMGMGAGYYDRFLLKCSKAEKLGLAYKALLQEKLPTDQYDVPIKNLVTEEGIVHTI